jgi:hypothetical protein
MISLMGIAFIDFQSLLIQGRGKFNCSSTPSGPGICNASNPECSPYVMTIIPGKTYRLRVSSLTALSALSFQIEVTFMTTIAIHQRFLDYNYFFVRFNNICVALF